MTRLFNEVQCKIKQSKWRSYCLIVTYLLLSVFIAQFAHIIHRKIVIMVKITKPPCKCRKSKAEGHCIPTIYRPAIRSRLSIKSTITPAISPGHLNRQAKGKTRMPISNMASGSIPSQPLATLTEKPLPTIPSPFTVFAYPIASSILPAIFA